MMGRCAGRDRDACARPMARVSPTHCARRATIRTRRRRRSARRARSPADLDPYRAGAGAGGARSGPIGVVDAIAGQERCRCASSARPTMPGTTPMDMAATRSPPRRASPTGSATSVLAEGGAVDRGTIGVVEACQCRQCGSADAVLGLEIRDTRRARRAGSPPASANSPTLLHSDSVRCELRRLYGVPPVAMNAALADLLADWRRPRPCPLTLPSGAGHDAGTRRRRGAGRAVSRRGSRRGP